MQSVLDEVDDGISYFYLLPVAMLSSLCFHLLWSGLHYTKLRPQLYNINLHIPISH